MEGFMLCKYCKKEFDKNHGNFKFCSKICRAKNQAKNLRNHSRECFFCKNKFNGTKNQKFCCNSCTASYRTDHIRKLHEAKRKYPKIEGLNRCQIFRKFNPEKQRIELEKDVFKRGILIQFLGGKCVNCGYEEDIRGLQLDHINDNGKEDRKRVGIRISRYYLKNLEEAKSILQVLCGTCHCIKTYKTLRKFK